MSRQSTTEHNSMDQSGVLISSYPTRSACQLQAKVTLGPGKMAFNNCLKPHMKTPLVQKEQSSQEWLATSPQVVINHEAGLQSDPNKGHNRCGEIARISLYQGNGQGKQVWSILVKYCKFNQHWGPPISK